MEVSRSTCTWFKKAKQTFFGHLNWQESILKETPHHWINLKKNLMEEEEKHGMRHYWKKDKEEDETNQLNIYNLKITGWVKCDNFGARSR